MQAPSPLFPLSAEAPAQPRHLLFATLTRIDGWGQGAWREISGAWQLSGASVVIEDLEAGVSRDVDDQVVSLTLVVTRHHLTEGSDPGSDPSGDQHDAPCDWVLRRVWQELLPGFPLTATTYRPGATIERSNACTLVSPQPGDPTALLLRLLVRLPMAGMCCDGALMARALRRIERFLRALARARRHPGLARHRHSVQVQRALRAALSAQGLIAFIGEGSRLARDGADRPMRACAPLTLTPALRTTIDLGRLGRYHGLGIRRGVTAIAGAPYHGKSTLLRGLIAGGKDHPPGDGRELVVCDPSILAIHADEGRRIKQLDLSAFFAHLPGGQAGRFSSERASGATSMASSVLQGIAGGCRLLAIDEDTAASNFLAIDATMRRLLGASLHGNTTLLELLPALAQHGISTVLVAGANTASLAASDRVLMMQEYQPHDVSARVARLLRGHPPARRVSPARFTLPVRVVHDHADCLFGPRHFLQVDATQPDRPVLAGAPLDLRRSGWDLDAASVRGALAAAAWVCRLSEGKATTLSELQRRYEDFIRSAGVRGLDPFATALITAPPWQLVVSVLERLPQPHVRSAVLSPTPGPPGTAKSRTRR